MPQGYINLCIFLLRSTIYWWCTSSFWRVQVPYTKWQFQRFRVVPWAVQISYYLLFLLLLTPRIYLECSSSFTLFLSASLSIFFLLLLLSCTPTSLWTTAAVSLVSSCTPPYFLEYAIPPYPARPFVTFSAMAGNLLFGMFLI